MKNCMYVGSPVNHDRSRATVASALCVAIGSLIGFAERRDLQLFHAAFAPTSLRVWCKNPAETALAVNAADLNYRDRLAGFLAKVKT